MSRESTALVVLRARLVEAGLTLGSGGRFVVEQDGSVVFAAEVRVPAELIDATEQAARGGAA